MKIYWDSSALFNALASKPVFDRFDSDEHTTRAHGFTEVFSHLTGRGLPMKDGTRQRVSGADAARMLSALAKRLSIRDLDGTETLEAIEMAERLGVQGARIHDLLHAWAAHRAGAQKILTRDRGFSSLSKTLQIEWP
jgi:predicted nucleic acid-binding protein